MAESTLTEPAPLYFRRVGGTLALLGLVYGLGNGVALLLGYVSILWASLTPPLLFLGAAMWLLPGKERATPAGLGADWERAFGATPGWLKLVWLLAFCAGVLAMMAVIFFGLAPL